MNCSCRFEKLEHSLTNTFLNFADESTSVLLKANSEYKDQKSLLMRTRNLLSTMQRQDVLDRYDDAVNTNPVTAICLGELVTSFMLQGDTCGGIFLVLVCCSICHLKAYGVTEVAKGGHGCH